MTTEKRIILFTPGGVFGGTVLPDTTKPTLERLQELVGGYIEPITVKLGGKLLRAYVDEDGKLKGLPVNPQATELYYAAVPEARGYDFLVGNVVVLEGWR